jgi:hypothetical protein
MPSRPTRTAVCILRVERQSRGLVITMTVKRDISSANAERVTRFSSTGEAAAAVTTFLKSFDRTELRPLCISARLSCPVVVTGE